jgi:hypothetical protein
METFGYGAFENDAGSDLVHDLKQAKGVKLLKDALAEARSSGWDSDECQTAVAAAEIIAALKGARVPGLPKEAAAWVLKHNQPPGEPLVAQARDTVRAILANSELKEIWDESGNAGPWKDQMKALLARLTK